MLIHLTKVTKTLQANTENLIIVKKKPNSFALVIWKIFSESNQKPDKTTQEIILMKHKNLCFLDRLLRGKEKPITISLP